MSEVASRALRKDPTGVLKRVQDGEEVVITVSTPASSPVVRRARAEDAALACEVLADAFHHDPVWAWAFDDDARRRQQHLAWFAFVVDQGVANGSAWMTSAGEAVALWVPPGADEVAPAQQGELEATIRALCGERAELILEAFSVFEENHPHGPAHHYLSLLATGTEHRGQGLGMQLLGATLAELDRAGAAAYLESTNPDNLRRYEAVGFQPYASFALPHRGPVVTTMWRDPGPTA